MKKFNLFPLILIASILFISCSKERLEKSDSDQFESIDEFYNLNQPEEQSFLIDSIHGDTIRGKDSTKIWGIPKTIFIKRSTRENINYPYTLKLIEAYSIKNMILLKQAGIAHGNLLNSSGQVKITAYKDTSVLALKENCGLPFWTPASNPLVNMSVFFGFTLGVSGDWNNNILETDYLFNHDSITNIEIFGNGYLAKTARLGWHNIAKSTNFSNASNVTFTASGTNTNNIDIYVIFNNLHNFIKVNNFETNLPNGEQITVFAIAKKNGIICYYKNNYTASAGLNITLNLTESSTSEILNIMGNL